MGDFAHSAVVWPQKYASAMRSPENNPKPKLEPVLFSQNGAKIWKSTDPGQLLTSFEGGQDRSKEIGK